MDILKYKGYEGTAELDMGRGVCRGKILFVDDLVTYESKLPTQLKMEFEAAVDDYLETCKSLDREPNRQFRGAFNVRVSSELHRAAALRALKDGASLNDVVVKALDCYLNVRADVNHNIKVTVEQSRDETYRVTASETPAWRTSNVH